VIIHGVVLSDTCSIGGVKALRELLMTTNLDRRHPYERKFAGQSPRFKELDSYETRLFPLRQCIEEEGPLLGAPGSCCFDGGSNTGVEGALAPLLVGW
jgi:hypothetical protein